jgi:predicted nucleic acid-binding protein
LSPSCRDTKDNKFVALALAAEADVLVSSDKDLLALHPWRGIRIATPAGFVARG